MTMTQESELLPCPFCGSENILEFGKQDDDWASVECRNCRAGTHKFENLQDAVAAWNTRARLGKGEGDRHHPVFAFLLGEGNLEGRGFGDEPPVDDKTRRRIPFWWRKHLRDALSAKTVEVGELVDLLREHGMQSDGYHQDQAQAILSRYNVTKKESV